MKRTVAVRVLVLTAVLGLRAAGQVDSRGRAEEEQRRAFEAQQQAEEALVNQRPEVLRLLERLHEIDRRLEEINRVAARPERLLRPRYEWSRGNGSRPRHEFERADVRHVIPGHAALI